MEHRWGNRFDLDAPAILMTADGHSVAATLRNASVSGALVETRIRPPVLSRVSIRPIARPGEWHDACVVRADPRGLALEWLDPGSRTTSSLLALRVLHGHGARLVQPTKEAS